MNDNFDTSRFKHSEQEVMRVRLSNRFALEELRRKHCSFVTLTY